MSISDDSDSVATGTGAVDGDSVPFSSAFLDFCGKVRNDDPSILPVSGMPFKIGFLREKEDMELADALLENSSIIYLELMIERYTKSSAEAMAKYIRTYVLASACNAFA
jgi:hypothetical protein